MSTTHPMFTALPEDPLIELRLKLTPRDAYRVLDLLHPGLRDAIFSPPSRVRFGRKKLFTRKRKLRRRR